MAGRFPRVAAVGALLLAAGCVTQQPAPVVERAPQTFRTPGSVASVPAGAAAPGARSYAVRPGDTLYSIAIEHSMDYRELARLNGIVDANSIEVGQVLALAPATGPGQAPAPAVKGGDEAGVVVTPLRSPSAADAPPPPAAKASTAPPPTLSGAVKREPAPQKLPYSAETLARLRGGEPQPATPAQAPKSGAARVDGLSWGWPTSGSLAGGFTEASKGLNLVGRRGQPVYASAPGKVVYSGSGLRGYGQLVIIKHNQAYLSAYAHNSKLLVKEGQSVGRGQQIAEMGDSDAGRVQLHFEIRRFGKPVDPMRYLPNRLPPAVQSSGLGRNE